MYSKKKSENRSIYFQEKNANVDGALGTVLNGRNEKNQIFNKTNYKVGKNLLLN